MNTLNYSQISRQSRQLTSKPILATYQPQQVDSRQQSIGKENRVGIRHVTSMSQIKYNLNNDIPKYSIEQQVDKLKCQLVAMQESQNNLNEQHAIQIHSINERITSNEQCIKQLFDSGVMQIVTDFKQKEGFNTIECKIAELNLQISNHKQLVQQQLQDQMRMLKQHIVQSIELNNQAMCSQISTFSIQLTQMSESLQCSMKQSSSNDLQRFQAFNEEVNNYMCNRNLQQSEEVCQRQERSPQNEQQIRNNYRCQLSAISENTLEESRIEAQLSQSTPFMIDDNGYLINDSHFLRDEQGSKCRLTSEQIQYLKSINVLEEIK